MDYKNKYLKYKKKYLDEKNKSSIKIQQNDNIQQGGDYDKSVIDYLKIKSIEIEPELNKMSFESINDSYIQRLNLKNSLQTIQHIWDTIPETDNKYLELRPYNGEKKLIIACGNGRIDDRNLDPPIPSQWHDSVEQNMYHLHEGAYTIDFVLVANPSVVANVEGNLVLPGIPDNAFDLIYFEGGGTPELCSEFIKRVINKKTNSFCIGNKGYPYLYSFTYSGKYTVI